MTDLFNILPGWFWLFLGIAGFLVGVPASHWADYAKPGTRERSIAAGISMAGLVCVVLVAIRVFLL